MITEIIKMLCTIQRYTVCQKSAYFLHKYISLPAKCGNIEICLQFQSQKVGQCQNHEVSISNENSYLRSALYKHLYSAIGIFPARLV